MAYRSGSSLGQLTWVDRAGKELGRVGEPQDNLFGPADPALSPDGRRVAIARSAQTGRDLWLIEMARNVTTRFTFGAADDSDPIWSPDSSSVVFKSNPKGIPLSNDAETFSAADRYLKPAGGAAAETLLLESPHLKIPLDWSPDGRFLLYSDRDPKTGRDLWVLPMTSDRKPSVFANASFNEWNGQFSPDERWVAYQSDESGQNEVYVRPFPAGGGASGGQWQVSTNGGLMPRWRRDGRELYYMAGDAKLMAVSIQTSGTAFEAGTPVPLFQTQMVGGPNTTSRTVYVVGADGRFLIFSATSNQSASNAITLIVNWTEGLKK